MPVVLNKLASLTRIRDIEVFELSVLKTLAELLKIQQLAMYKFESSQLSCRLLSYSAEKKWSHDRAKMSEQQEVQIEYRDIPQFIKAAKDWIDSTKQPYIRASDDGYLCVYPVAGAYDNIVGYLSLEHRQQFNDMESLIISSILSISHNFHSLLEENQQDKLTGLLNRKTFEENVGKIQDIIYAIEPPNFNGKERRARELNDSFWLAIMDIDHFKQINDNYGHIYGDEVLLLVARMMQKSFRSSDLLFRFGGEEFVVILRSQKKDDAKKVLERFRKAVESFQFPRIESVTISVGATKLDHKHAVPPEIVGRADQALYYAKAKGRNQLHFYEDLVEKGEIIEKIDEGSIELF